MPRKNPAVEKAEKTSTKVNPDEALSALSKMAVSDGRKPSGKKMRPVIDLKGRLAGMFDRYG